jgi:hypothetical protein
MARLTVLHNPLDTSRRRLVELDEGVLLLDWLDVHEPAPGRCTRQVWINGQLLTDRSYRTKPCDEVLVAIKPGDAYTVGYFILQALISAAIGYIISRIFAPSKPKAGNTPSPSQVYGIAPPRNSARLGEPIPVFYGTVFALPDYAAQPYTEYVNNEQFLYALLCLGQGECDVHAMTLGDSDASVLPADVVTYQIFGPADHASTLGVIQAATGVRENVVTSVDVADQELLPPNAVSNLTPSTWYWRAVSAYTTYEPPDPPPAIPPIYDFVFADDTIEAKLAILPANPALDTVVQARTQLYQWNGGDSGGDQTGHTITTFQASAYDPNAAIPPGSLVPPPGYATVGVTKWVGPFETCKAGQAGTSLELDFVFGGGLFTMDNAGNLGGRSVTVTVEYQPINDAGATTGPVVSFEQGFTGATNTALRFTHKYAVPLARYLVRVSRKSNSDGKATTSERLNWTGLKFALSPPTPARPVYGAVTMAAVKLRASNGIASDAASSIRFRVTRRLPPPVGGASAPTSNPADAFADIVCARYGGNRPRNGDELDLAALNAARVRWAGHNGFNAVFDQPSTVWEALSLSVQTVSAAPLPVGTRMSLMQDGVQPVRAQMFTDANMARASLQITHAFDRDGTPVGSRVEYRDPRTFSAAAIFEPAGAPDYETISLFGCTDAAVAQEHATLAQNRRRLQRTTIAFGTELEGLNCLPGDRIGVQASMPRWAQGARVVSVAGLVLTLDVALVWTAGATHAVQLRDPQGRPQTVKPVQPGATPFEIVLPSLPFDPVAYGADMEVTSLSFGVDGEEITDWTVTAMQPQGDTVTIQATNYDPAVWAGAAAHLFAPVPQVEPQT